MYKKLLQVSLTLLSCVAATGQGTDKLREYYALVNKAELAIIDDNPTQAAGYYEQAFTTGHYFPSDKYNAFVASYFMKDTIRSVRYFNDLARLGQKKESLIKYFLHTDTVPQDAYLDLVTRDYDSIRSVVMAGKMPEMAAKMDRIFAMDQDCRGRGLEGEAFDACDNTARDNLYHFVDTYGFPGAGVVGIMEYGVVQAVNIGHFDMMIYHARFMDRDEKIFMIANENLHKGNYDARRYAITFAFPGAEYPVLVPDRPITKKELAEINRKRAEIYLEPLEDHYRKITFHTSGRKYTRKHYCFLDAFMCMFALSTSAALEIVD